MIYVMAPYATVSGGPELLQQLCYVLNKNSIESKICYYSSWMIRGQGEDSKKRYAIYDNPSALKVVDTPENIVVIPETATYLLRKFHKSKKVLWWLSVDFFYNKKRWKDNVTTVFGLLDGNVFDKNLYHLCQCKYAQDFLVSKGINKDRTFFLSDYLNDEFIQNAKLEAEVEKQNVVIYNPKKGFEYTQQLINAAPDIKWIPIQGMTPNQVRELMQKSKLYIDFGNHPGKDRMPREAAISGCCIVTGRRGAAANDVDVPIPGKYKIDEKSDDFVSKSIDLIRHILGNYEEFKPDFDNYRQTIRGEEKQFETDAVNSFNYFIREAGN
jgi:hypothetical protein